jgi:hypothetical protein
MSISVEVSSSIFPKRRTVLDFYCPKLTNLEGFNPKTVQHVDVVTTWKGLSISQAHELLFWERATRAALESYVEEMLIAKFVDTVKDIGKILLWKLKINC